MMQSRAVEDHNLGFAILAFSGKPFGIKISCLWHFACEKSWQVSGHKHTDRQMRQVVNHDTIGYFSVR